MEEYVYDPLAGFHLVHDLYIELTKFDYHLNELYEYSVKELLFILKYKREGIAYDIWRRGSIQRAAVWGKQYPKVEKMLPELFEKKPTVKMPDWLRDDYQKQLEERLNRGRRV